MRNRKLLIAAVTALVVMLLSMVWWFNWRWSTGSLVVSRETTYIDGPFDADGQPDYTAALNNLLSAGVTPENNAAVLLVRAMGPAQVPVENSREFFGRLGIPPISPTANYFDIWYFFARRFPAANMPAPEGLVDQWLDQIYEQATQRPWSDAEPAFRNIGSSMPSAGW